MLSEEENLKREHEWGRLGIRICTTLLIVYMRLGQLLSLVVVVVFDRLPLAGLSGMFLAMLNMTMDNVFIALVIRSTMDYVSLSW